MIALSIPRAGSVGVVLALCACAGEPAGTVVVVDAQPWGRANAAEVEVIVWNAAGVEKSRSTFALAGDGAVQLPVRVWVRAQSEGDLERFVIGARLVDDGGELLVETAATGETGATQRTALLCIEDGCRGVGCATPTDCSTDAASCTRCVAGACTSPDLVYGDAEACPLAEARETACYDEADGDGDGAIDCADDDCDGRACTADDCESGACELRRRCSAGACACPTGDTESECANGMDDDCDALADCADSECPDGTPCDALGRLCSAGLCECAGTVERCANGIDDDCDGEIDCADADCQLPGPETDCGNGVDDDCNGAADCSDPACDRQRCGTTHACCGEECTDISRTANCGGCGLACAPGRYCFINDRAGAVGWSCSCGAATDCPSPAQYCYLADNRCSCRSGGDGCDRTQSCSREMDDWNFCYYPWNS